MPQDLLTIRRVVKRDGTVSEFDRSRFDMSVEKAANETGQEVSLETVYEGALKDLQPLLQASEDGQVHAEQLLDAVEVGLMDSGYNDVAKAFIRYRHRRDRRRELGSDYSRAIADLGLQFEIQGNVASWLDAVGRAAAAKYLMLAEMPAKVARYAAENYLYFPNLVGFGRTVERVSLSVREALEESRYRPSRNLTSSHRLSVTMSHIVSLYSDVSRDVSGEQCYYGFDRDLGEIIRGLSDLPPSDDAYRQAAQSFVYSLNAIPSRTGGPGLSVTLGLDTTPEGLRFSLALIQALQQAQAAAVCVENPHVVFLLSDESNWNSASPGRELLENVLALAESRGGVSFAWDDGYEHAYFSGGDRVPAGDCVSLSIDINAAKLVAEAGGEFNEAFGLLAEAVAAAATRHDERLSGKGNDNFPALSTLPVEDEWGYQKRLVGRTVMVGVVGLGEAARILDPDREGLESTAALARVMAGRMRQRLAQQGERFVLYPASSRTAARRMYDRDRSSMSEKYGVASYLPAPAILPSGYPVDDRMALEGDIYNAFGSSGRMQVERERGRAEIEAGLKAVRGSGAVLGVTGK